MREKHVRSKFLFLQHIAEPLFFKGLGVENLISAAGSSRKRNQKIRLAQLKELADGICAGS